MSTEKETVDFILQKLGSSDHFSTRAMFGEYALYADGKVVALICEDTLYVKIVPESQELEELCEKGPPYPRAKDYYVVSEDLLTQIRQLPNMLLNIAAHLPSKKAKKK